MREAIDYIQKPPPLRLAHVRRILDATPRIRGRILVRRQMEKFGFRHKLVTALSWPRITISALALVAALAVLGGLRLWGHSSRLDPLPALQEPVAPPIASMRYLPTEVQAVLVSLCKDCSFADSNAAWIATDVVMDDRLPRRRLTRTERQGREWIIEYEHGGIATFEHRLVLSGTSSPALLQGSSCIPDQARKCSW